MIHVLPYNLDPLVTNALHLLLDPLDDFRLLTPHSALPSKRSIADNQPTIVLAGCCELGDQLPSIHQQTPNAHLIAIGSDADLLPLHLVHDVPLAGAIHVHELNRAFVHTLRAVAAGATAFSHKVVTQVIPQASGSSLVAIVRADLSPREKEVLSLVASGEQNKQIASRLNLADSTVRNCVSEIYAKFGVKSRAQLLVQLNQ